MNEIRNRHRNIPFLRTLNQSRNEQLRYLPQSVKMEEAVNPHIVNLSMTLISAAIVIFILWASFTEINEVAKADGEIVPKGFVQLVQHLDGGIVTEILTGEGDLVKEGQVLVSIDDGGAREDLAEAISLQNSLEVHNERIHAYVENREPIFSTFVDDEDIVQKQLRIFQSTMKARKKEQHVIEDQIAQRKDILDTLQARLETLQKNSAITEEIVEMKRGLMEKGSVSKNEYLEAQKDLNNLQGDIAELQADIAGAQNAHAEYKNRLSSLKATHRDDDYDQVDRIEADLRQNKEVVRKLESRVSRLDIKAPVTGLVKGLKLNTIGGVVEQGQTLMEIVPVDKNLVIEAKISTADIGHVAVGQKVKVKLHSYDFSRYGAMEGRLDFVTATTFLDDNGEPYYRGRVVLVHDYIGGIFQDNKILPGMTVEVDIVTGKKSIIAYLLKPIGRAVQTAMTER